MMMMMMMLNFLCYEGKFYPWKNVASVFSCHAVQNANFAVFLIDILAAY
jgi:hypothetical protein